MWARKAQAPTARACHRIPGHGPRGAVGLGRIGRAALPLSRRGPARHRHCIPGAGEAREAAAASMRSRWRARPAPAPEAELAAGRGLRASGSELGNPARPPHSPLSKAPAKPPDAASPGPAAQGAPTGRRPDAGAACRASRLRGAPKRAPRRRSHRLLAPRADILDFAVASDPPSKSFDPCALCSALRPPAGPVPCLPPTGLPGRPLAALRAGHPVPQPGSFSLPTPAHVTVLSVPASGPF